MSIFRVNKTKNFTIINNHILRNKDASLKAKGLLVWMLSCDDDWNFSLSGMLQCLKEKEDAITNTLNELENLGYLKRTKLMPESYTNERGEKVVVRSRIEFIYDIFEQPVEILHTGFQSVEFQEVDSQSTENPAQRNTNIKEELKYIKEELNNKEPEPALSEISSEINNPRRNFRKEHEILEDKLQSGKDIDAEKQKKKKSPAEKTKDDCLAEIDKRNYSEDTKELLREYYLWASSGNDVRKIKGINLWRSKLDYLDQLIKQGEDSKKVVQQSIDKKWYKFEGVNKSSNNSQTSFEPLADKVITGNREEAQKRLDAKRAAGVKTY